MRVPLLVISPHARVHMVSHAEGDHSAVIQTIEAVFGLQPLASLPDERAALAAGDAPGFNRVGPPGFHQRHLGPPDVWSPETDSLFSGIRPGAAHGTRAYPAGLLTDDSRRAAGSAIL